MLSGRNIGVLSVAAILALGATAQAKLIDTFEVDQTVIINNGDPGDSAFMAAEDGMLGGERDVTLTVNANPIDRSVRVDTDPLDADQLIYEAGSGVEGSLTLEYDGDGEADGDEQTFNSNGLTGSDRDLTDSGTASTFLVDVVDTDADVTLDFEVFSGSGNETQGLLLDSPGKFYLPFSAFTNVDFTDVGAVRVSMDAPSGLDLTLGRIATVPAPAALPGGLVLMGLMGIGRYRRHRQAG